MDKNKTLLNPRFHFCGSPSLGPLATMRAFVRGGGVPAWPELPEGATVLTHRCRTAVRMVLDGLGFGSGDEVLVPSYNCGSEIDPIIAAGCRVEMYRVAQTLDIDIDDLVSRIRPQTRAVYVTHYFGRSQQAMDCLADECRGRGVLLFEDCALSLFSRDGENVIGRHGDVVFYSLMKTFGIPDGGAVVIRRPIPPSKLRLPSYTLVGVESARLAKRWFTRLLTHTPLGAPRSLAVGKTSAQPIPALGSREPMPREYFFDGDKMGSRAMSRISRGVVADAQPAQVVSMRRGNYARLLEATKDVPGIVPVLGELREHECPLIFPFAVSPALRRQWMAHLKQRGAHPTAWWSGYHPQLDWSAFPEACSLKDSVVALPVHQQLQEQDMDFLADVVRQTAKLLAQ